MNSSPDYCFNTTLSIKSTQTNMKYKSAIAVNAIYNGYTCSDFLIAIRERSSRIGLVLYAELNQ